METIDNLSKGKTIVTKPARLERQYDVLVIGAGLGGLSCAAYLAQAGKRVLVCEQHEQPGGYCTAHPSPSGRFQVELTLQYLMFCDDGQWVDKVLRDLGVRDRIEFKPLDTFLRVVGPDYDVTLAFDRDHTEAEMICQFPTEARTIHRLLEDASLMIRIRPPGNSFELISWQEKGADEVQKEMGDLSGRVALVTGSRQGIRAAMARRLAAEAALVVINGCSSLEGAEVCRAKERGDRCARLRAGKPMI